MGKYEVTQAQGRSMLGSNNSLLSGNHGSVLGSNPSMFDGCDDCPVEK
jgi:hypothetical protein